MRVNGIAMSPSAVATLARRCAGLPDLAQRLGFAVDTLASDVWIIGADRQALLRILEEEQNLALATLRDGLRTAEASPRRHPTGN